MCILSHSYYEVQNLFIKFCYVLNITQKDKSVTKGSNFNIFPRQKNLHLDSFHKFLLILESWYSSNHLLFPRMTSETLAVFLITVNYSLLCLQITIYVLVCGKYAHDKNNGGFQFTINRVYMHILKDTMPGIGY